MFQEFWDFIIQKIFSQKRLSIKSEVERYVQAHNYKIIYHNVDYCTVSMQCMLTAMAAVSFHYNCCGRTVISDIVLCSNSTN